MSEHEHRPEEHGGHGKRADAADGTIIQTNGGEGGGADDGPGGDEPEGDGPSTNGVIIQTGDEGTDEDGEGNGSKPAA